MKYLKLKNELKQAAIKIRQLKNQRKSSPNGYVAGLDNLRFTTRHKHIAYCLLRGRTLEQIEPKYNEAPNEKLIERYMEEHNEIKEKIVCACG